MATGAMPPLVQEPFSGVPIQASMRSTVDRGGSMIGRRRSTVSSGEYELGHSASSGGAPQSHMAT